ncbi:MAG: peptidoglycan binding domain-containing protein, partial [Patescibacteria group bacterium]|nr:peptidoglycan binding domain-containing protein [Patescibacteria group bacterium]
MSKSKQTKHKKSVVILKRAGGIFLALFIFVGVLAGSFFGYEKAYANKILLGVKVGSINLGGKTKQDAKAQLDNYLNNLSNKNITVISDNQISNVKLSDLGVSFNSQNLVDQAYDIGRENNYQIRFTHALAAFVNEQNISLVPNIDQTKSRVALEKISSSVIKDSKDAYFKLDGEIGN